ncbi:MAG: FHA domain-containing protein, partial [Stackebrandtia sp.]
PPSDPQTRWSLVATADREYFDLMRSYNGPDAPSLQFPDECPSRRFPLNQPRLFIGRRSRRRGIDPDIDLSEPPEDPGVSHAHAMIVAAEGWSLVDVGSSNGTYLNGSDEPAPIDTPVPLNVGDRICLGAWTRLTVVDDQRDSDAEAA